jgi:hypothetical protein
VQQQQQQEDEEEEGEQQQQRQEPAESQPQAASAMAASLSAGATLGRSQLARLGATAAPPSNGDPPISARETLQQLKAQQNTAVNGLMKKAGKEWGKNKGMQIFVTVQLSDGMLVSRAW